MKMVRETRHLWIGNLPSNICEERINDHFKRYGKVQSVKILGRSKSNEEGNPSLNTNTNNINNNNNSNSTNSISISSTGNSNSNSLCATVAFIDIRSAAKAHNSENKIEERILLTGYYEPPASSTASSAIFIHESREDALLGQRPSATSVQYGNAGTSARSQRHTTSSRGLPPPEDRLYERERLGSSNNYDRMVEREPPPYIKRNISYHDEGDYSNRNRSRDRTYNRNSSTGSYPDNIDRNTNHFRAYNRSGSQHFENPRYPSSEQLDDSSSGTSQRNASSGRTRLTPTHNPSSNNNSSSIGITSTVTSPPSFQLTSATTTTTTTTAANTTTSSGTSGKSLKKKRSRHSIRSQSASPSPSHSRSTSLSSDRSQSPSSSSNLSSSSESNRSVSPKCQSPLSLYGNRRPSSHNADKSSAANSTTSSGLVATNSINSLLSQGSNHTPQHISSATPGSDCSVTDKEESRPLAICVRNLPVRSTDTSLKDGLFHEYKKHGKVTMVKVIGQGIDRFAVVCFKKAEDVEKALDVSKDKLFFGCKIEVTPHEGIDAEDNDFRPLEAELDEYHPKATRTLFVGNLEKDITTTDLRSHFEQFGEIIEIDIKKQGPSTYAFIQYSDIASVVKAMRKLDGENLGANRIKLGFGKSMPTNCVWLHGISETTSEKSLQWQCTRFGPVLNISLDRERGNCLVFYENVECAQIAVTDLKGRLLNGRKLQVDFANRECQNSFYEKVELSGQCVPSDRPWERRTSVNLSTNTTASTTTTSNNTSWSDVEERSSNYEVHSSRSHNRYENPRQGRNSYRAPQSPPPPPPPAPHPSCQRAQTLPGGRGRGYRFNENFSDRRHRTFDNDDHGQENEEFLSDDNRDFGFPREKVRDYCESRGRSYSPMRVQSDETESLLKERYTDESPYLLNKDKLEDCIIKERSSRRESTENLYSFDWKSSDSLDRSLKVRSKHKSSDGDSHKYSPSTRRLSQSTSPPPCKERKSHSQSSGSCKTPRSPTSSTSSIVNSPFKSDVMDYDVISDKDLLTVSTWRRKSAEENADGICTKENIRLPPESISDSEESLVMRDSVKRKLNSDSDTNCEKDIPTSSETIGHLERKKRLLACIEPVNTHREGSKHGILSADVARTADKKKPNDGCTFIGAALENVKPDLTDITKKQLSSSGADIKILEKNKVHLLNLIEQLGNVAPVNDTICESHIHHSVLENSDIVKQRKHQNSVVGKCKNNHGAKDASAIPVKTIDATSSVINKNLLDPRRQIPEVCSSSLSLPSVSFSQFPSSKIRRLERSDACEGSVEEFCATRVSSTDTHNGPQDVHSTTSKETDQGSSEVSSSSDKVATNKRSVIGRAAASNLTVELPMMLPLPEFAISFPGLSKSVVSHPGTPMTINNSSSTANSSQQLTHVSPKSTSIMSPLSNFSPSNAVPKRVREKTADAKAEVSTSDMCVNPNDTKTPAAPTKPVTKQEVSETTLECKPTNNCSSKQLSIEDRIRALDVKYNQWTGSSTASATAGNSSTNANASSVPATVTANVKVEPVSPCIAPTIDYSKYNIKKKSQVNANSSSSSQRSEPSDITRSLLSKSSIFDQDSKRLEHINEKYEPKDGVNSEANGASQTKPIFRTKAAAKEFSTLPVEKLTSETPSKPTPAQVHTSHDPPQTLTRKLSEPIKLPTMKKEPSLPTPSPGPQTAPPRTNSFSFAGRTSLSTTPTRTHLAPGSSLGTTIKKEPLLSPVTLSNNTCTTKDVRRDPRQLAKKENTIHSLNASQFQCAKDSAAAAAAGRKEGPSASFGKQQHSFQYNSSNSVFPSSGSSLNENSKSCSLLTQMASKKIETVQSGSCNSKKSSSAEPMEIETVDWPKVASTTATTESTKLESKSGKMEKVKGFILGGSKEGIDRSDSASSSLSIKKEKKSSPEIGKLNSEKTKHTESGKSKEERKACKREGKESSSSSLSKHESKEKCKMKIEGKTEKKGEGFKEKHKSMDKEKEKMRKDKDKERMPKEKSSKDKLKDSEQREREKANKALKAEMKKLGINLDEEPVYFSMYDKVKARSSANQSLKEAKDMESMRQKFNQLKQCRAKKDDKKDSSNQNDTDSDSDSSSRPVSKSKAKLLANSTRKRKLVIDSSSSSSSDEDESNRLIQQQKKATKKLLSSKPFNSDSESDSDFDSVFGGESVKSTSFVKKCRDTIYSSDSSPDEVTSPTSNKVKSKIPASSTDELRVNINSSDEEAKAKHLKQLNRKKEAKKKVLKEKEKYKEEKLNSKLAPAPASAPDPSKCTTKTEKEPEKGDVLKRKSSDEKVHKKRNKIKKEKEREKDKWRERNKEDGGENRVKEKEKEKEKGDKDEEKDKGDENEKEVESWSNNKEKRSSEDYERDDGKGKSIISKRKKKKKAKLAKQQKDRENKYGEKGSTSYESKEQRSDPGFKMDSEHEMKLDLSDYEQNSRKIDRLLNNESEPETRVTVLKCGPSPRSSESSSSHHLHHHNKLLSDSSDWNKGVSGDAGASKQTLSRETCKISSETISEKSSISSSSSKMAKKLRKEVGHNQSVSQALLNPTQKEEPKLLETRKEEVAQVEERQQKTEKQNNKEEKSIKDLKPGLKEEKGGKDGGGGVGGGGGEKLLVSSKEDKSIKTEKMKKTEKNKEEKRKKSKKQIKEKDKVKPSEKENSGEREKKVKEKDLVEELAKTTSAGKDSYLTQSKIGPLSPLHHSTAPPASFTEKSASSKSFSFSGDEMRLEDEGKNEEKQSKPSSAASAAPIKEEGKESCPSSQSHPGGSTSAIRQLNKEEKVQQTRHFEVEAAIESRRLEEELLSDETWKRLKEPKDIFEEIIDPVLENKQKSSESNIKLIPDDSSCIFGVMGHSDTKNPFNEEVISRLDYKEDEVKDNEIDQRKIEDDLAVSALLQEMNVATPDIVKEPEPEPEPYINRMVTSTPDLDELSYLNTMPDDEPPPLQIAEESESDAEVEPALELDNKPETVMESSEKDTQQQLKVDERNSEAITSDKTTSNDAVNDLSEKPQELELPALAATIVEAPAANEEPLSNAEEPVIIESTQQTNTENIKTEVQTIAPATSLGPPSKDLSSLHEPQVFDEKAAGDIPNISSLPAVAETTTATFIETIEKANEASNPVLNKFENEPMESKTEIPKTEIDTKVEVLHAEAGNSCEIKQSSIMEPDVQKVFIHNVQPQIKQERTEPHVVSTTESITVDLPSFAVNKPGEEILTPLRQQPAQFIHVPPPADVNPSQAQRSEVKDSLQVNEQEKTESLDDSIEVDDRASEETKDETDEDRGKGAERPRRGRRAKTRKYSESSLTLPRYESGCAESNNAAGALQKRGKCSSLEKPRRSGRVSNNTDPSSEDLHSDAVNDEISGDDQASKIQSEEDIVGEKGMEVKRKRGRKKKVSGNDPYKQQDGEPGKQKERILLSLPLPGSEKGNNNSEGRKAHSPYDVFEFRDSEEDTLPPLQIESMHSSSTTKVSEMKQQSHVETEKQKCEELVKGDTKPEQEATGKEYVTELSQHGKLSITIRLHQKDGQDGNASTAEVVKTSKALLPEENKSPKAEEVSLAPQQQLPPHQQQQQPLLSVPAPCEPANTNTQTAAKPTRKSARLMQQASKTTVDEVIEDVVKSVYKDGEGPGTRSSKRVLRSVRKSDDTVESDEETHDGKTDSLDADSDSRGDSKLSLRSYRITRSSARNSTSGESEANDSHNAVEPVSDASGPKRPAFPVLKVELPKISQQSSKISEKKTEENINPEPVKAIVATKPVVTNVNEVEEPESRSSPAALVDPVTGILTPIKKHVPPTPPQPPAAPSTNDSSLPKTSDSSAPFVPPVCSYPSVVTCQPNTVIQEPRCIPSVSERLHSSNTAMKLKTGKGLNFDNVSDMSREKMYVRPPGSTQVTAAPTTVVAPPAPALPQQQVAPPLTPSSTITQLTPRTPAEEHVIKSLPQNITAFPHFQPNVLSQNLSEQQKVSGHENKPRENTECAVVTNLKIEREMKPPVEMSLKISETSHHLTKLEHLQSNVPIKSHHEMNQPSIPTSVVTSVVMPNQMQNVKMEGKSFTCGKITPKPNQHSFPESSHVVRQSMQSPGSADVHAKNLSHPKDYAQNLSTNQHSHIPHSEASEQKHSANHKPVIQTPPSTPTPPSSISSVGHLSHNLPSAGLHLRPQSQPPIIVPPPSNLGFHPGELTAFMQQQMMYAAGHPHYAALHPEIRAQHEAQARAAAAMGMNPRFPYPPGFPLQLPPEAKLQKDQNIEKEAMQQHHHRLQQDEKNKIQKMKAEAEREREQNSLEHMRAVVEEAELKRHAEAAAMHPPPPPPLSSLRFPPGMPYPPIRQIPPHLLSPHERFAEGSTVPHPHVYHQGRPMSAGHHHMKSDEQNKHPLMKVADDRESKMMATHPKQFSNEMMNRPQPLFGIPPAGSPAPGYLGPQIAHSPSSLSYRKDNNSMPQSNEELHRKMHRASYPHKEMSPGPLSLSTNSVPGPSNLIPAHSQSLQLSSSHDEAMIRRGHSFPQMGSEAPLPHGPPPAHAMSQPASMHPQTPPHASQVPPQGDSLLLQRYPVMWQGLLALKNDQAAVQMHFVSGSPRIAHASLPPVMSEGGTPPVRIAQRMRLEQTQLEGVARKMQMVDEHCILLALPCGRDHMDVLQQSNNLRNGFINYLQSKQAAGIVNSNAPGSQQPAYVIHIFPSCDFSNENLARIAPDLLHSIAEIAHLLIIIATV